MRLFDWLRFPHLTIDDMINVSRETTEFPAALLAEVEQDARYAPYLQRQDAEIRDLAANERIAIPNGIHYESVAGLSKEMIERLNASRPQTLAAAARVRGVTPAALAAILVHAKRAAHLARAA
jgi:tRNA uridine 5-carboxymethylaminomethyl modification enzyme